MKKKILQSTREVRVKKFISAHKFLAVPKYYKGVEVSLAAYDSWAAQGQAGSCQICSCQICGVGHYNGSFRHKRFTTTGKSKGVKYYFNEFGKLCGACLQEVEKQCQYKFKAH